MQADRRARPPRLHSVLLGLTAGLAVLVCVSRTSFLQQSQVWLPFAYLIWTQVLALASAAPTAATTAVSVSDGDGDGDDFFFQIFHVILIMVRNRIFGTVMNQVLFYFFTQYRCF